MVDPTYQPKVHMRDGGDAQVIADGGEQKIESGGKLVVEDGGYRLGSVGAVTPAGNSQGTATALTAEINVVTGADNTKGVALPTAQAGMMVIVKSVTAAKTLDVYPATGGDVNGLGANTAITMAAATAALFVAASTTQWYTVPLLPS